VLGPDELCVVANTGDDVEIYGVHVAPDPDLITYWLADAIDDRGYGIRGDSFEVMAALEAAGRDTWFRLGDRDLAMCLLRTERMRAGERLTDAHAAVVEAMGVAVRVLPMADEPVRTAVRSGGRLLPFQEFMIVERAAAPIDGVELDGIEAARPTPDILEALARAEAIVVGPSNPVISIGPIMALPGMREALAGSPAAVVAVSPFVGGRAVKGPTEQFCAHSGIELSARGIADHYGDLVDALVSDEAVEGIRAKKLDTSMDDEAGRHRVAKAVLELAR
jgi:LPPG:FO 2-phospho-L-lactate transferase